MPVRCRELEKTLNHSLTVFLWLSLPVYSFAVRFLWPGLLLSCSTGLVSFPPSCLLAFAVSGEAPSEAVVSKYGTLMERRLAVKYIAEHGKDPVSGEPLSEEDLVVVKSATPIVRPRPPAATSIPALLASMQNEWDALTLETFELRNKYKEARKELTTALYQHDAACRVIARLTRERDEARAALANVKETLGAAPAVAADGDRMDVDKPAPKAGEGITDDILEKMVEVSQRWVWKSWRAIFCLGTTLLTLFGPQPVQGPPQAETGTNPRLLGSRRLLPTPPPNQLSPLLYQPWNPCPGSSRRRKPRRHGRQRRRPLDCQCCFRQSLGRSAQGSR